MASRKKDPPVKMRPVSASQSLRKSYNKVIDDGDQNPFATMYNRSFGGNSTIRPSKKVVSNQTPVKPSTKV